jgi:type IV pilus assembly protein PilN
MTAPMTAASRDRVPASPWRDAVPCVDLMPHPGRQARRQRRLGLALVLAGAGAATLLVWAGGLHLDSRIETLAIARAALDGDLARLRAQAAQGSRMASEADALQHRLLGLRHLQQARGRVARWLDAVARQVPPGVYLTAVERNGGAITVSGVAESSDEISGLVVQLARVQGLAAAQLLESRQANEGLPGVVFKIGMPGADERAADDGESDERVR